MKRALLLVAIAAAAGLVWWLASDANEAAPPVSELGTQHAAPAQPAGFAAEAPPPHVEDTPAPAQSLAPQVEPQPQRARPTRFSGIVVRKADGTLLDNVIVQAVGEDGQPLGRKPTQQGRFELGPEILTRPASWLSFTWRDPRSEARNESPVRQVSTRIDPARLTTSADQIKVELDTGWIIRGKVVDEDSEAITAAKVTERDIEVARSRVDGTFIARDFDLQSPVRLVVSGNGWVTSTADVAPPAQGSWVASVQVVLAREEPGPDPSPPEEPVQRRIPR